VIAPEQEFLKTEKEKKKKKKKKKKKGAIARRLYRTKNEK